MSAQVDCPVLFDVIGVTGRISLNRPKALHALNAEMCQLMLDQLGAWLKDDHVKRIVLDHADGRGFCAGGDIRMIAESGRHGAMVAREFFRLEYQLNHLLFVYPKPIVAFVDGVVMGGGVGISDPAPYRICTQNSLYAMPETGIGLFPDVGGSWFLPRLDKQAGMWLALTGSRLKAPDMMALGLATHYMPAEQIEDLKAKVFEGDEDLETLLAPYKVAPEGGKDLAFWDEIARIYGHESLEKIMALLADMPEDSEGAKQVELIKTKSPQSLKVSFELLRRGAKVKTFAEALAMEFRLGGRIVQTHDFQEGVRAVVVDKDNAPSWKHSSVTEVLDSEVNSLFLPLNLNEGHEWLPSDHSLSLD